MVHLLKGHTDWVALTLFVSYCGYQAGYEKAKIRAEFYSKLSLRYERLWNQVNQQLEEAAIFAELNVLLEQESLGPADPDEEFDDRLRERVYRILIQSLDALFTAHRSFALPAPGLPASTCHLS
jgi:hypothetical protein